MKMDMGEPKPAADEPAVAEGLLDLARRGVRGDVEVLGLAAEQQVAHTAPHKVGEISMLFQLVEDPYGVVADPLAGDGMF